MLDVKIPWNPDSETIIVNTDTVARKWIKKKMNVIFYDKYGDCAGSVLIKFDTVIEYQIGWCSKFYIPFPVTLPTRTQKTWIFTYNYADKNLVFYCNGVQVLNVVLSDSTCNRYYKWSNFWNNKPTQIKFYSKLDDVSDSYSIYSKKGTYIMGVIDSRE